MSVKVSVIIPAYNAALSVGRSIDSVLNQSYSGEIEVLVVDDSSCDRTKVVVSDLARTNRQIKLFENVRTKGPSGARNTALREATGEFIAFLDADDIWAPNHLKEGVGALERNDKIDALLYNFDIFDSTCNRRLGDWFSKRSFETNICHYEVEDGIKIISGDMFNALLDESFVHLQSLIVRSKVVEGVRFNENVKRSEDRDFAIKLSLESRAVFAFKNLITGTYFRSATSLTSASIENSMAESSDHITLFTGYLKSYSLDARTKAKLERLLMNQYMIASYCYRQRNNFHCASRSLINSMRYGLVSEQFVEAIKIVASRLLAMLGTRARGAE